MRQGLAPHSARRTRDVSRSERVSEVPRLAGPGDDALARDLGDSAANAAESPNSLDDDDETIDDPPRRLALGEPHVDTRSGPPPGLLSGDAFLFAEKWAAAAGAPAGPGAGAAPRGRSATVGSCARVRRERAARPAVPTLFAALTPRGPARPPRRRSRAAPGTPPRVCSRRARWHAPRASFRGERTRRRGGRPGGPAAAVARRRRVAAALPAFSSVGFHVPRPLGPMPALCLACVAASPAAPRTRARAPRALEAADRLAPGAFASAAEARALAASFAYACAAAEETHAATHAAVFVDAHGDDRRSIDATRRAFSSRSGGTTEPSAETRKTRAAPFTPRGARDGELSFPRIAAFSRGTRGTCSCVPNVFSTKKSRVGAFYSTQRFPNSPMAIRRGVRRRGDAAGVPPSVSGRGGATALYGHFAAGRSASTRSASPRRTRRAVAAAAAVSAALADDLAGGVLGPRSRQFLDVSFRTTTFRGQKNGRDRRGDVARRRGVVRARRRRAERVAVRRRARVRFDASSHVEHARNAIDRYRYRRGAPRRKTDVFLRRRLRRVPVRRGALVAAKCARSNRPSVSERASRRRVPPRSPRTRTRSSTSRAENWRVDGLAARLCREKARARASRRARRRDSRGTHEGYTFSLASTPAEWRGALDPRAFGPRSPTRASRLWSRARTSPRRARGDASRRMGNDIETLTSRFRSRRRHARVRRVRARV